MYSLAEAAKATGKGKTTIHKALKSGRISATKNEAGEWQIDPAELHRVYPPANDTEQREQPREQGNSTLELALLQQRVSFLESQIDDLREDRDHWRQQATRLLTDQRPRPEAQATAERDSGFWRWLRGRKR